MKLAEAVGRAQDVEALYQRALSALEEALGVDRSAILVCDDDGALRFRAWRDLSNEYRAAVEGHSPWSGDAQNVAPILVPDVVDAAELSGFLPAFRSERIAALAFIPLLFDGKLVGKFMLYYREAHSFDDEEVLLAVTVASHVAAAIARRRYEKRLKAASMRERRARRDAERLALRLASLQSVTSALSEATTMEQIARVLVTRCIAAVTADDALLYRYVTEEEALVHFDPARADLSLALEERWALDDESPYSDAARSSVAVFVESPVDLKDRYSSLPIGREVPGALAAVPLLGPDGVFGVVAFEFEGPKSFDAEDRLFLCALVDQVALALERSRQYEAAQKATRSREETLAIVSHDLRTPLSAIALAGGMLSRTVADLGQRKQAVLIVRNAERMEHLIRDLLDFSRIDAGRLTIPVSPLALDVLMQEAAETWRPLAAQKRVELIAGAPCGVPVLAEREAVLRVLGNLLANAVRHAPEGTHIRVHTTIRAADVLISVEDEGPGVAAEHLPHLFDRWFQAERRSGEGADQGGGIGLGLFISRGLVEALGGSLTVESEPGEGAAFRFTLRRAPDDEGA